MKKCPNCGMETDTLFCGGCGTDLRQEPELVVVDEAQETTIEITQDGVEVDVQEVTPEEATSKKKPRIGLYVGLGITVVAIIVGFIAVSSFVNKQSYKVDLAKSLEGMYKASATAEEACILTLQVWEDAIWGNTDNKDTKEYIEEWGDFDAALANLYKSKKYQKYVKEIEENNTTVEEHIGKLSDPPKGYEKVYDEIVELYPMYQEFVKMAISPQGSYNSYSEDYQRLDKGIVEKISKIEVLIPQD